jgi:hypothetical protein
MITIQVNEDYFHKLTACEIDTVAGIVYPWTRLANRGQESGLQKGSVRIVDHISGLIKNK